MELTLRTDRFYFQKICKPVLNIAIIAKLYKSQSKHMTLNLKIINISNLSFTNYFNTRDDYAIYIYCICMVEIL